MSTHDDPVVNRISNAHFTTDPTPAAGDRPADAHGPPAAAPATLHLERPEAVHGAHVETASSLQGPRPGHPGGRRSQVPGARRRPSRSDLDHVRLAETVHGEPRVGNAPASLARSGSQAALAAADTLPELRSGVLTGRAQIE